MELQGYITNKIDKVKELIFLFLQLRTYSKNKGVMIGVIEEMEKELKQLKQRLKREGTGDELYDDTEEGINIK